MTINGSSPFSTSGFFLSQITTFQTGPNEILPWSGKVNILPVTGVGLGVGVGVGVDHPQLDQPHPELHPPQPQLDQPHPQPHPPQPHPPHHPLI